ncbi:MAG: tRNA (adenosine(37)-N6)-threonylcarbamoyltransferase complex dimerization subunit type 1 TsaB [Crocinitomicaceae bacterium]
MALILCIETATKVCSVALALNGKAIAVKESKTENFSHSENLNLFIESLFIGSKYELTDVNAIAVSMGPGSYTGLRIGASTAKGLAYGLQVPVIGIGSLLSLANQLPKKENTLICPMFDARRMEVYSALYNQSLDLISEVEAKVITSESYLTYLNQERIVFIGPGAEKCMDLIQHPNAIFDLNLAVSATSMASIADIKFQKNEFENLAYFEPFYLKDFIAGKPKKLL